MPGDLQFTDPNINGYQSIPSFLYPTLETASIDGVSVGHSSKPVVGSTVADGTGAFLTWKYPIADNLFIKVAVGYQLQVIEDTLSAPDLQADAPPGRLALEQIQNLKVFVNPANFISLSRGANGRFDIPPGILSSGSKYIARVRSLLFSEKGAGTLDGQYFKYTRWGTTRFSVNAVPAAINLNVNGQTNPTSLLSHAPTIFGFTFSDPDGPSYLYRVQVGTTPGPGFAANIWDSGLISAGTAFGSRDFKVTYAGQPLTAGVTYAWRVQAQDGMSDGGFTPATDTFKVNRPPTVKSMKINGKELLFQCPVGTTCPLPAAGSVGSTLSWTFQDPDGGVQTAYAISLSQRNTPAPVPDIVFPVTFTNASSIPLPTLAENAIVDVRLKLRDNAEFGPEVVGAFMVNAKPTIFSFQIDGKTNPGNVATSTPTFSWMFKDETPGDSQTGYRLQVATDDTFLTTLWDTGLIMGNDSSVIYGSTPAPVVPPTVLVHGAYYYARLSVTDGLSTSDYELAFFAVNKAPNSPMLLSPSTGAFSGILNIGWSPAGTPDDDGDPVTYTIEITNSRSSNQGWTFLAGPLSPLTTSYPLDLSGIRAGNDYGIRVIANDGFTDSNPLLGGTSPLSSVGLGFTILNHAPVTPSFILPTAAMVVSRLLKVEWVEAAPADVDGDSVFYLLDITRNSAAVPPLFEPIDVFSEGTNSTTIDISSYADGASYQLRLTSKDSKGAQGATVLSAAFSIVNTTVVTDFEKLGGRLYIGTSDGRVIRASEAIWQVQEDWSGKSGTVSFDVLEVGSPNVSVADGRLSIKSPPGSTYILRQ